MIKIGGSIMNISFIHNPKVYQIECDLIVFYGKYVTPANKYCRNIYINTSDGIIKAQSNKINSKDILFTKRGNDTRNIEQIFGFVRSKKYKKIAVPFFIYQDVRSDLEVELSNMKRFLDNNDVDVVVYYFNKEIIDKNRDLFEKYNINID